MPFMAHMPPWIYTLYPLGLPGHALYGPQANLDMPHNPIGLPGHALYGPQSSQEGRPNRSRRPWTSYFALTEPKRERALPINHNLGQESWQAIPSLEELPCSLGAAPVILFFWPAFCLEGCRQVGAMPTPHAQQKEALRC